VGRPLSAEEVGSRLLARFGDDVEVADTFGQLAATVTADRYHDLIRFLRDEPELACDYCDFTGGVDLGPETGFEVVTQLTSTEHHHDVRVKVRLPATDPVCPTISDLFPTCDWHERETMFPLRKDFPLMSREVKPWPGVPEGEEVEEDE